MYVHYKRGILITTDQVKQNKFINSCVELNIEVSQANKIKTANLKGRDQGKNLCHQ